MKPLPIRRVNFNFSQNYPNHYFDDNSVSTHLLNSYHLLFPNGEKYFIKSISPYLDKIEDPEFKQLVKSFIAQEAGHSREHEKFKDILIKQGYNVDAFDRIHDWIVYELIQKYTKSIFGNIIPLSVTAAAEHFTATFAESLFLTDYLNNLEPEMKRLLLWHGSEELEHKSVAFNLLKEMNDNYFIRILGLFFAIHVIAISSVSGQIFFMIQDKETNVFKFLKDFYHHFSNPNNPFKITFKSILEYLNPNFHPDQKLNLYFAENFFRTFNGR